MMADSTTPPTIAPSTTAFLRQHQQQQQQQLQMQQLQVWPIRKNRSSIFPARLYDMLENAEKYGYLDMISWMPDGRSFRIDANFQNQAEIVALLKRCQFKQSKLKSFMKQLHLYSFQRLKKNQYSHVLMVRGRPDLFYMKSKQDFLEVKTRKSVRLPTEKKVLNNTTLISSPTTMISSSTSTTITQQDAYNALIGRHPLPSPSIKFVEQYPPSLPIYIPQQEQANIVDWLGGMYSKNKYNDDDDDDNNNNININDDDNNDDDDDDDDDDDLVIAKMMMMATTTIATTDTNEYEYEYENREDVLCKKEDNDDDNNDPNYTEQVTNKSASTIFRQLPTEFCSDLEALSDGRNSSSTSN